MVGGSALAALANPRNGAVGRRPTCAMCQVGRFTSHHRNCDESVRTARRRARRREGMRCLTTDGPGRTAVQQHRGAPSAGVAWCNGQRTHATPAARRIRCSVAPPAHHTGPWVALLRARGAALTSCRRGARPGSRSTAVVAQWIESTSLRTRGSGVRISPTA